MSPTKKLSCKNPAAEISSQTRRKALDELVQTLYYKLRKLQILMVLTLAQPGVSTHAQNYKVLKQSKLHG